MYDLLVYLAGIVYIEKYGNAATLQKPIPIWFVFPQDLHKNEWPRNQGKHPPNTTKLCIQTPVMII